MPDFRQHLRYAVRQLRKNPGFSFTVILILAISIGATTAIFSLFHAVLMRPLPYAQPDRLVTISTLTSRPGDGPKAAATVDETSYPNFFDWRKQNHSFEGMATYHRSATVLAATDANAAQSLESEVVSAGFFSILGLHPEMGRDFNQGDEQPGSHVVILSHQFWVSAFHASPSIIGQTIQLPDEPYTVVGVLPDSAQFPITGISTPAVWTTLAADATGKNPSTQQRGWQQSDVIARLRPGVTVDQAQAEMNAIQKRLAVQYPDDDANALAAQVMPALKRVAGDFRPALQILMAAVGALLLIACTNIAGLMLARGAGRQAELALRTALGASRGEIVSQLVIESLVLSMVGGAAGVALATFLLKGLLVLAPANLPRVSQVAIDLPVLAFSLGLSVITGLIFGLLPARRLSRLDPAMALRDGLRTSTAGRSQNRLHSALVITETAMGLILLVSAGLLIRSFMHVISTDPGFRPDHTLTFRIGISPKSYPKEARDPLYQQIISRLNALPGVKSTTAAFPLPMTGGDMMVDFKIQGRPAAPSDEPDGRASLVEPGFFETLGIQTLRGRVLTPEDNRPTGAPVIVINDALARKYFPGEDPIGKRLQTGFDDDEDKSKAVWREIVGVTGNVKRLQLTEAPHPEYYIPYGQVPIATLNVAVRVEGNPNAYIHSVSTAIAGIDRELPVYRFRTFDEGLSLTTDQPRFQALLLAAFAAIALLLAATGLYAVLSYMVAQRRNEIGLRMALGAQRGDVMAMILRRGLMLAGAGLSLGIAVSLLLTRFLASMLYGVKALDPITFAAVGALLLVVCAGASFVPAARAASLDPMETLRNS